MTITKHSVTPRPWQQQFLKVFHERLLSSSDLAQKDFLKVVAPGAGKTFGALWACKGAVERRIIDRMLVVVHTRHLLRHWRERANEIGLKLSTVERFHGSPDFHGAVITYQSMEGSVQYYAALLKRHRTMVIFDEVHHLAEQPGWGDLAQTAFEGARLRLVMSGTPWRTDGKPIPFCKYDHEGKCEPDYQFSYADGISADPPILREICFQGINGPIVFLGNHGVREVDLREDISEEEAYQRLNTCVDLRGAWLKKVLKNAHEHLLELRADAFPQAKGIIVTKPSHTNQNADDKHAQQVAQWMRDTLKTEVCLAVYDAEDPVRDLEMFAGDRRPWLVTVRMASEGLDIPELRVGVYATTTRTRLFLNQFVGRLIRNRDASARSVAHVFLPQDRTLTAYAEEIDRLIAEGLRARDERSKKDGTSDEDLPPSPSAWLDRFISADAGSSTFYAPGGAQAPEDAVESLRNAPGIACDIDAVRLADYLRRGGWTQPSASPLKASHEELLEEQREAQEEEVKRLAGRLMKKKAGRAFGDIIQEINNEIAGRMGGRYKDDCITIEDLKRRRRVIRALWDERIG